MEAKIKYYVVREVESPVGFPPEPEPEPPPPTPPVEPPPEVAEEGYIVLEGPTPAGADTFQVNIVGGTNVEVDGYSIFVGYPDGLQALSFAPGGWVVDYLGGRRPFQVFQVLPSHSAGAVPSQHVALQCGFWENGHDKTLPVTVPQDTVLGTLTFKWSAPGSYILNNASEVYGRNMRLPALYTRLHAPYLPPDPLGSLNVAVPIA